MGVESGWPEHERPNLEVNLSRWLQQEGYPLEFAVASAFRSYGFRTRQGEYVGDGAASSPREVDVVASMDSQNKRRIPAREPRRRVQVEREEALGA